MKGSPDCLRKYAKAGSDRSDGLVVRTDNARTPTSPD